MKIRYIILFIFSLYPILLSALEKDSISVIRTEFSENKGQWPEQVLFKTPIGNGNLWIEHNALLFDLYNTDEINQLSTHKHSNGSKNKLPNKLHRHTYKLEFKNSKSDCKIIGENILQGYSNYFLSKDKNKWKHNIHKFEKVEYSNLYDNINLTIYEKSHQLKWDFIIKEGGNPNSIQVEYKGINSIRIKNGNLIITTSVNKITELAPYAYQINNKGEKTEIRCKYILENNIVSYKILDNYDKTKELIIDPTLVFASYTGAFTDNWGFTATYDSKGFLYAGGIVFGGGYPTTSGAFDISFSGVVDISISKFDTTGSQLIYSTYLGGSLSEVPASLIVNSNDELLVLGTTSSSDFPVTATAYDTSYNGGINTTISSAIPFTNGSDLFITHFSNNGSQLIGSTFIGGSGNDGINSSNVLVNNYGDDIRGEIMTDQNNNIYIVSTTKSSNYPTTLGVFQMNKDSLEDGIISKFDNNLSNLLWSTYFGGNNDDAIYGIKVNKQNNVFITGGTASTNLYNTTGGYVNNFQGGGADGYVARINSTATSILTCSYIGSSAYDQSYLLDIDKYNNVYLFGQTKDTGTTFIYNALWNSPHDGQFLTKLNSHLSARVWSTTWGNGSNGIDVVPSAFMVDLCNRVYLSAWGGAVNSTFAGGSTNNLPITTDAMQSITDGSDYYLMVMADDASSLDYGSFYGGDLSHEHVDGGTSRFDNKGRIYQNVCAGCGGNSDFPTTAGCYSDVNNSTNCNNGVFKVDFNIPAIVADYDIPPVTCVPDTSFFYNTSFLSHPSLTQYQWDFGDGNTSTLESPFHIYNSSGIYQVSLIIYDPQSCNLRDTLVQQVVILSGIIDTLPYQEICPGNIVQIGILPINDTSVSFAWTPSSGLSNSNISNPFASPNSTTWYTLTMSTSQCSDTYHQKVEILNLIADAGNDTTVCINTITLSGSGNYNNINYLWSSNSNFTDTLNNYPNNNSVSLTFSNPNYIYFQIEKAGCSDYDSVFIDQRIKPNIASISTPLCNGDSNGSILISVNGGANPLNYIWSNGQTTNPATNLNSNSYSVTITDADGCTNSIDTLLAEPEPLTTQKESVDIPCAAACIGKAWANINGGTSPYNWQWDDANSQTTNPAMLLCSGVYNVTVTDANNCITNDSVEIIDSSLYITFKAWAESDTIYKDNSTHLHSTMLGNNFVYSWTPSKGLSNPTISNPIAHPNTTTTYIVDAVDQYGCSYSDTITIFVLDVICEEPYIYVPNAFTPNNDGKNDILYVNSSVGYEMVFKIYDKWGELIFESNDISNGWDGRFREKELRAGVYVYFLELTCYNHQQFIKKGNITLIR